MSQKEELPASEKTITEQTGSKCIILKDLVVTSASVFMTSLAYSGLCNLQSSLNDDGDLGNKSLTVIYFFAILSSFFLTVIIDKLGLKWTLIISIFTQIAYPLANFWPVWYSLYVGAAITGLGSSPMWTAANAYLILISQQYGEIISESSEVVISRFFGIFFMIFRAASVSGSVISSFVFQKPDSVQHLPEEIVEKLCGTHYCYENIDEVFINFENTSQSFHTYDVPGNTTINLYRPSTLQVNMLFGIYVACAVLAVPIMGFIRPLKNNEEEPGSFKSNMYGIFKHSIRLKAVLLTPLAVYSGVTYAFTMADYVVGYITCALGIDSIGFIMAAFGASSALGSLLCGPLLKYTGRQAIFIFGGICNIATLSAMALWTPTSHSPVILYIFASSLGITCTIWVSQLAAFVGYLFADEHPERAFASFLLYQMLGNCAWHGFSIYLCLNQQIYFMIGLLVIGLAGYFSVEIIIWKDAKKKKSISNAIKAIYITSILDQAQIRDTKERRNSCQIITRF